MSTRDETIASIVERLCAERWAENDRYWNLRAEIFGVIDYYRTAAEYADNASLAKMVGELEALLDRPRPVGGTNG